MPRVAIVTDSNSGIRQNQAEELRVHVLPMPFTINGKSYFEDINLTQEMFYEQLGEGADVSTSQPSPGSVLDLWNRLLTDHDEIVHIPMSSGLSASYETGIMLAEDFGGRVQVVDNKRISVTLRQSAIDAVALADAGRNALQIKEHLEETALDASIYILMDTLKYLKKGGRITPAAAAIGTIMNIKPVLQIQGAKLDSYAKARGTKQGRKIMLDAMRNDLNTKFADRASPEHMWLYAVYTNDAEAGTLFRQEVETAFPGYDIHMAPLPLSVACHIGPGAVAIACCVK
jgi:DegV family protein with EDD domain